MAGRQGVDDRFGRRLPPVERVLDIAWFVGVGLAVLATPVLLGGVAYVLASAPSLAAGVARVVRIVSTPISPLLTPTGLFHLSVVVFFAGTWLVGLALLAEGLLER